MTLYGWRVLKRTHPMGVLMSAYQIKRLQHASAEQLVTRVRLITITLTKE